MVYEFPDIFSGNVFRIYDKHCRVSFISSEREVGGFNKVNLHLRKSEREAFISVDPAHFAVLRDGRLLLPQFVARA